MADYVVYWLHDASCVDPAFDGYVGITKRFEFRVREHRKRFGPVDVSVAGHGSALQVHHFFPRALLKKHKVKASDIDTFANYVVIRQDTNLHAGADEPASYIEVALAAAGKDSRKVRAAIRKQGVAGRARALARGQLRGLPRRAPDAARRGGEPLPGPLRPRNPALFRPGPPGVQPLSAAAPRSTRSRIDWSMQPSP